MNGSSIQNSATGGVAAYAGGYVINLWNVLMLAAGSWLHAQVPGIAADALVVSPDVKVGLAGAIGAYVLHKVLQEQGTAPASGGGTGLGVERKPEQPVPATAPAAAKALAVLMATGLTALAGPAWAAQGAEEGLGVRFWLLVLVAIWFVATALIVAIGLIRAWRRGKRDAAELRSVQLARRPAQPPPDVIDYARMT